MRQAQIKQAKALLSHKELPEGLLKPANITLISDISVHASKVWQDIYQHPYVGRMRTDRSIHGISHVARVAYYIPVIANLYCQLEKEKSIHQDDVKLLQLAALFHDCAREDDGVDRWDNESAEFLYHYLTLTLDVPDAKAVIFAECIANKDYEPGQKYQQLIKNPDGSLDWKEESTSQEKTWFQKILHDADCLDII